MDTGSFEITDIVLQRYSVYRKRRRRKWSRQRKLNNITSE